MTGQKFKVFYIDDQIDSINTDANRIRAVINTDSEFDCELVPPPDNFAKVLEWQMDALLVDLDLSTPNTHGQRVSYYGSTLASEIRVQQPNRPIILTTGQAKERWKVQVLDDNSDADLIWFKGEIIANSDQFRSELRNLILGFRRLAEEQNRTFEGLMTLLGAEDEDEKRLLRESGLPLRRRLKEDDAIQETGVDEDSGAAVPPHSRLRKRDEKSAPTEWQVPNVARWLRTVVLEYPGVTYDAATAAARLGISKASFESPEVQALFASAMYRGPLSEARPHWWRGQLLLIATDVILAGKTHGTLPEAFSKAFEKVHGVAMDPSLCVVDGSQGASWLCHVLRQPVQIANSLTYFPDARPSVMEQARVSFKAIRTSPLFDEALVDPQDRAFVEQLWDQDQ